MITEEQRAMKKCIIEGCNQKHKAKNFCSKHYERFKKHGDPFFITPPQNYVKVPPMFEHFHTKINKKNTDECWEWNGARDRDGYGDFNFIIGYRAYKKLKAHRVSYEFHIGPIPKELLVCHKCDNPSCVNPGHLFLGTAADNAKDMVNKKRSMIGEKNNKNKLTESQVRDIKRKLSSKYNQTKMAKEYGVSRNTIKSIKNNTIWNHVGESC